MSDQATRRIGDRLRRRIASAMVVAPLVGLAIGAVISAVVFDSWGRGSVMVLLAAVVASMLLGFLWAGYSSLESPDPGHEPSDTVRPIADREDLVREESGDPLLHDADEGAMTHEGR
ncbi:MAG TPA: hypothetical protein VIT64_12665 [Ilumatobacteraceae bacterium]